MSHSCSHIPRLDVIVPTLVSRRESFSFMAWLDKWKVTTCLCVRIIAVLDTSGSSETEVDALEQELWADLPVTKKLLTPRGSFGSPGAARNRGLLESSARWITFWDADDSPDFAIIDSVLERLDDSQSIIQVYQFESWLIEKQVIEIASRDENLRTLARYPGLWRMIIPGDCGRRITFTNYLMGEDVLYLVQLLTSGHIERIKFFSEKLYRYNIYRKGQLTSSKTALKDLARSLDLMSQLIRERVETDSTNESLALLIYFFQCLSLLKKQPILTLNRFFLILSTLASRPKSELLQAKSKNSDDFFDQNVFVYATGGLGNQLFQYAAACYYATDGSRIKVISDAGSARLNSSGLPMLSNTLESRSRSVEFINIGKYQLLFSRLANTLLRINIDERVLLNNLLVRNSVALIFQPIFSILLRTRVKLIVCHEHGFTPHKDSGRFSFLVIGYFQSYVYADVIKEETKKSLAGVAKEVLSNKLSINTDGIPKILIIHMRRGDYLAEPKIGCLSDAYFIQAHQKISKEGYEEIWVMTEDADWARALAEFLPAGSRFITSKDFSTLESLALMTLGSAYIISNSTFSWWGAYLSQNVNSLNRVFAPTPWYREIKQPKYLIPEYWEKNNSDWIN